MYGYGFQGQFIYDNECMAHITEKDRRVSYTIK